MKKVLALAVALYAGTAFAAVSASKHNINNFTTPTANFVGTGDVCYYCHAAHNTVGGQYQPLWARSNPVTSGYTTYSSSTVSKNIAGAVDQVSLACLSCHDGSIATNQTIKGRVGGGASDKFIGAFDANKQIGPNISNDHPVSINWPGTAYAGLTATVPAPFIVFNTSAGATTLTCASCHEPHGQFAFVKFLRADPASGSFCVTCHANK
jgi:predicted CXXCH cytochrome family protein